MVIGDELRIVQVLNNLLSNAAKFTAVGKIAVEVVKTAQTLNKAEIFFIIKDTGIGIAKEDLPHIFERFYRVDKSHSREIGGTGLGLAIVHKILRLVGGDIQVQSELGKGSTFTVRFRRGSV